jgi:hypothetical protein
MITIFSQAKRALVILAIAAVPAGAAVAAGDNGILPPGRAITMQPAVPDVGQGRHANLAYHGTGLLPLGGNRQGQPQTANSLTLVYLKGGLATQHRHGNLLAAGEGGAERISAGEGGASRVAAGEGGGARLAAGEGGENTAASLG